MGDREHVRQQLSTLEKEFHFIDLQSYLESIFSSLYSLSDLPAYVQDKKVDLVAWLYPGISLQEQERTRKTVLHLYPLLKHVPVDAFKKPTYRQAKAYLNFWAALVSEESRAVIDSLVNLDLTRLDRVYLSKFEEPPENQSWRSVEVESVLMMLEQARRGVDRAQRSEPVTIPKLLELAMVVEQRRKPNLDKPYYEESQRMLISIDPCNDITEIVSRVELILKEVQERMANDHESNWSKEEREFYGDLYIDSQHPKHEFVFDSSYSSYLNAEKKETFLDRAFTSLLYFELIQKGLSGPEIGKKFFGKDWQASTDPNYRTATKDASSYKKFAKGLIHRALSGWPL